MNEVLFNDKEEKTQKKKRKKNQIHAKKPDTNIHEYM